METKLLDWTGHALVDVGIATICAMSSKTDPGLLTLTDLDVAADEMERYYFSGALSSYLTCVFMNSEYVQPGSGEKKEESRKRYANRVLRAHRTKPDNEAIGQRCAFSNEPASHLIHRGQMPLLTGEGVLNFFPAAAGGLFIAGAYLTSVQALPLGGRRSEGKLLIAHSDDPELTLAFAGNYLRDNRRLLSLALSNQLPDHEGTTEALSREHASWDAKKKQPKYPDAKVAFTLVASDLLDILSQRRAAGLNDRSSSLQVYWLSSSGQGPSLEIFTLPSNLIRFLREVSKAATRAAWNFILAKGWASGVEQEKPKTKARVTAALKGPGRSRNPVLNDLLMVYESGIVGPTRARLFVRRHLLNEHRGSVELPPDQMWELTTLFLMEVLGMTMGTIERIKAFADILSNYVVERNDKKFFKALVYSKRAWEFRGTLEKAQRNEYLTNQNLLFGFDDYMAVFEADDNAGFADWSLIRDLICIRIIEQLHAAKWLVPEDLKRAAEEDTEKDQVEITA